MKEGVKTLEDLVTKNQTLSLDLTPWKKDIYEKMNIACVSISMEYDTTRFSDILNAVKTKLLKTFIELDKLLGNLDDLDVTTDNIDLPELKQTIYQIIYQDNSVKIGDKNKIENSELIGGNIEGG